MDDSRDTHEMIAEATRLLAEATHLLGVVEKRTRPVLDVRTLPPADEDKLEHLFNSARDMLFRDGGWLNWQDLRPAHRDREVYGERVWIMMTEDSSLETEEQPYGSRIRRRARVRA